MTDDWAPTDDRRGTLARIAGNSGWNLVAFLVGILANLITLPFVIRHLGIFEFGTCGLFIALAAPLSLIGTTLGQSAAQGIARYRARDDRVAVREFCSTIIAVGAVGIGVSGTLLGIAATLIVRYVYPSSGAAIRSIGLVSITLAAGWVAQQLSLLMQGIHVGCQSYRRIATINGLGAVSGPALIFGIVSYRPDVEGYILALALGYGVTALFWAASTAVSFPWSLVYPRTHAEVRKSITAFAGWQMLAQLAANLAGQIDRYLLGAWVTPAAVGYFNISQRLEEVAYIGVLRAGDALFPQFSANSSATAQRRSELFFRASWMLNLVAAMVLGPLLPWAPSLLLVWVGPASSAAATHVLQILTVGGLLGCAGNVFTLYALGIAKTRFTALLSVVTAATSTVASVLLLRRYGFAAAGVGAVLGMLANLSVMILLTRRHFGTHGKARRISSAILAPIGAALVVAGGLAAAGIPIQHTWSRVVIGYLGTSLLIMCSICLLSGLSAEGRKSLADLRAVAKLPLDWLTALLQSKSGD